MKTRLKKTILVGGIALTTSCLFTLGGLVYYSHTTGSSFSDSSKLLYTSVTGIGAEKDHKSHGR